jgi:L-rhamnose mutarotase
MTKVDEENGVRRIGMVIGLKEECIADYRQLHDGPGVRDLLRAYNIFNFNIFLQKMPDGKFYEFAYYEYHGSNTTLTWPSLPRSRATSLG